MGWDGRTNERGQWMTVLIGVWVRRPSLHRLAADLEKRARQMDKGVSGCRVTWSGKVSGWVGGTGWVGERVRGMECGQCTTRSSVLSSLSPLTSS
jgi:hypothetical protein